MGWDWWGQRVCCPWVPREGYLPVSSPSISSAPVLWSYSYISVSHPLQPRTQWYKCMIHVRGMCTYGDSQWYMYSSMDSVQMSSHCSGLSHHRGGHSYCTTRHPPPPDPETRGEKWGPEPQYGTRVLQTGQIQFYKSRDPSPPLTAVILLSITVYMKEQEVEGWEEAEHKSAEKCTCLPAARSDIWGHRDRVRGVDAQWCTGTETWQPHKWLKQKKKSAQMADTTIQQYVEM